jgi:galactokinase
MLVSGLRADLLSMGANLAGELSRLPRRNRVRSASNPRSDDDIDDDSSRSGLLVSIVDAYGYNEALIARKIGRLAAHCQAFIQRFGDGPVRILRAPARINILGEHIDYVSYIPTASLTFGSREHDMVMMLRPAAGGRVRGASTDARFDGFEFQLGNSPAQTNEALLGSEWLSYLYKRPATAAGWANYLEGACRFAQMKYGARISMGLDLLIDSSVPAGGGASSSSALCVLAGAAVRLINGVAYERAELALDSSQAEWYVGTRGGSMDQTTILLAQPNSAIKISYSNSSSIKIPLPAGYSWVTFFTHPANKSQEVMNQYNDRAFVSRILIPEILSNWDSTNSSSSRLIGDGVKQFAAGNSAGLDIIEIALRELPESIGSQEMLETYPAGFEQCSQSFPALADTARQEGFSIRKRALHHVGEVRRVARAAEILSSGQGREESELGEDEKKMAAIGALLSESHASLRDLYQVSTNEVEELVRIIDDSGLACGARLMGGGFGGNVLALVPDANSASLVETIQQEYYSPRDRRGADEGSVMVSTPGLGLSEICSGPGLDVAKRES